MPIADEIIVGVDDRTTDATARIARAAGARVHFTTWTYDFSAARNIGLDKARKDWILMIDCDDRLTEWGCATIKEVLRKPDARVDGYCFQVANCFLDGRLGQYDVTSIHLWQKSQHIRYVGRAHEQPMRDGKRLRSGVLSGGIMMTHLGYDPEVYARRQKDNRARTLLEMQLAERPDRHTAYLLAHHHANRGRRIEAATVARRALAMRGELNPQDVYELEALVS